MDVLAMLKSKLRFIEWFYDDAAKPFVTMKRHIEKRQGKFREDPPGFDMEYGEPPYLSEWFEADQALNILGQSCLCLCQTSFRDFLDAFVQRSRIRKPNLKGNWFEKYQAFFKSEFKINWTEAPVDLHFIEDISLTRNSIEHTEDFARFWDLDRKQTREHKERYPNSIFTDEIDRTMMPGLSGREGFRIKITRDNLLAAIQTVERFCTYIEEQSGYY